MNRTPTGTPVGVDDPYDFAGKCDHLTSEGTCRYAFENPTADPAFSKRLRDNSLKCPVANEDVTWRDCPHYRSRSTETECIRCGLTEHLDAHSESRPLLEEHHLSYPNSPLEHEITVMLCRWCHAKVHDSWARITDDVNPDPEALAEKEGRRSIELDESEFTTAADRYSKK